MAVAIEVFTRWAASTPPWKGFLIGTCPRCVRAHRFEEGRAVKPCRDLEKEGYTLVIRDEPMNKHRRPLRAADLPQDPDTPWVRVPQLPADGSPPF
jgi:hypothetical protein